MKKGLLFFILLFFYLGCSQPEKSLPERSPSFDGTAPPSFVDNGMGYVVGEGAPIVCQLTVRRNKDGSEVSYNIRSGPSTSHPICDGGTLKTTQNGKPVVVSLPSADTLDANWVYLPSPYADNCPYKAGYVSLKAFDARDQEIYRKGTCGRSFHETSPRGRRAPAPPEPPPSATSSVGSNHLNTYGYRFVLDRCLGLKNDRGLGHYHASRIRPIRNGCSRGQRKVKRGRRWYCQYKHQGVDYYAPEGTPVRSPCRGKVTYAGVGTGYGNMVKIACHGSNVSFLMAHLDRRRVRTGDTVQPGTALGGTGRTGNAGKQAPQVHVEVRIGNVLKNPQHFWKCGGDSGH